MSAYSPEALLSQATRDRCISLLSQLPKIPNLFNKGKSTTPAAVLIPICVLNNTVSLLFTVRSMKLKNHSGQISFPGGKTDPGETAVQTALRETFEELGIPEKQISVWGQGFSIPVRNEIQITPVIGVVENFRFDDLQPSPDEVAEVFTVPIEELCSPSNQGYTEFMNGFRIPVYTYGKHVVWGITAMITDRFLQCFVPDLYKFDIFKSQNKVTNPGFTPSKL